MMRLLLTATGRILGLLLTLASIIAVALFVLTATGTARFVPVLSNSMAPDMPKGSLAVVSPVPAQDITADDVIVFTAPDSSRRRVIHRVEHRYGPEDAHTVQGWTADSLFLATQGDNNPSPDPWILVLREAAVWRQLTVIPYAGWPFIGLSDSTTRVITFAAGGAAISAWALAHIWRRPAAAAPGSEQDTEASSTTDAPVPTDKATDRTALATTEAST